MSVARLMVFPDRPDCLVVYLPARVRLRLPELVGPISREDLATACADAGLDVRISLGTPGHWGAAYRSLHGAEVAERRQRQNLIDAAIRAEETGSGLSLLQERSAVLTRKVEVDEQIRVLKTKIGEVKSRAYTKRVFLPVEEFRRMERELAALKDESQALQVRASQLREQKKDGSRACSATRDAEYAEVFLRAARSVLSEDALQRVHGVARSLIQGEEEEYG